MPEANENLPKAGVLAGDFFCLVEKRGREGYNEKKACGFRIDKRAVPEGRNEYG